MAPMGTRPAVGLGLLATAIAGTFWLWPGDEPPPSSASAESSREVPQTALASDLPERAPEPVSSRVSIDGGWWTRSLDERVPEPLATSADNPYACTLRGRLTVRQRPWLHPSGIEVRLTRSWLDSVLPTETSSADQRAPATDDVLAATDADGWFVLRFAPTAGELFFLIDKSGDWSDFQKVPRVPRAGDTLELGDVWLDDRGGIVGVAVDDFGNPVTNAMIRAIDDPLLDLGGGLDELRAARNRGIELFRVPGNLASGPLPEWVVRRDKFLPFPTTTTDRSGRFELHGLRPGAHDVFITHEQGYASAVDIQVASSRATNIGRVTLRYNTPAKVTFVDEAGKPWVGAEVAFVHEDLGFGTASLRTSSRGIVEAFVPAAERTRIAFAYPGGGPWIPLPWWPNRDRIQVDRPKTCMVTLIDERAMGISGGQVRFYQNGAAFRPIDRALPSGMQPVALSRGQYRGARPCEVIAVAAAPGFAPAICPIKLDEAEVSIMMLPIRSITVRTVDRQGNVVPHASVRIQAHKNPELSFPGAQWDLLANDRALVGNTDDEGLLRVPVWDTFLSIQADHPAFGPSPGPKLHPIPGQVIDLALRRPARIEGRLLFHQRPAAAGFRIRARQKPPVGHVLEGSGWLDEQLAVTDTSGMFGLRGLNAGIWELRPELPKVPGVSGGTEPGSQWRSVQVMLDEDQELFCSVEAEADPMATNQITGTVTRNGTPIEDALVRLRKSQETSPGAKVYEEVRRKQRRNRRSDPEPAPEAEPAAWARRFTTDSFGNFAFGDLEPDTDYELRVDVVWQDRLQFLERRVIHTARRLTDAAVEVAVNVDACSLQLSCSVTGRAYADRMMRLRQIGQDGNELARYEVLTSSLGIAVAEGLPAGTWSVEPMHGGYCRPAEFVIKPGETAAALVEILGR
jgi:hypothetical protein